MLADQQQRASRRRDELGLELRDTLAHHLVLDDRLRLLALVRDPHATDLVQRLHVDPPALPVLQLVEQLHDRRVLAVREHLEQLRGSIAVQLLQVWSEGRRLAAVGPSLHEVPQEALRVGVVPGLVDAGQELAD